MVFELVELVVFFVVDECVVMMLVFIEVGSVGYVVGVKL